eukprot:gene16809-19971_t
MDAMVLASNGWRCEDCHSEVQRELCGTDGKAGDDNEVRVHKEAMRDLMKRMELQLEPLRKQGPTIDMLGDLEFELDMQGVPGKDVEDGEEGAERVRKKPRQQPVWLQQQHVSEATRAQNLEDAAKEAQETESSTKQKEEMAAAAEAAEAEEQATYQAYLMAVLKAYQDAAQEGAEEPGRPPDDTEDANGAPSSAAEEDGARAKDEEKALPLEEGAGEEEQDVEWEDTCADANPDASADADADGDDVEWEDTADADGVDLGGGDAWEDVGGEGVPGDMDVDDDEDEWEDV